MYLFFVLIIYKELMKQDNKNDDYLNEKKR
jgi:hypothetical protein